MVKSKNNVKGYDTEPLNFFKEIKAWVKAFCWQKKMFYHGMTLKTKFGT